MEGTCVYMARCLTAPYPNNRHSVYSITEPHPPSQKEIKLWMNACVYGSLYPGADHPRCSSRTRSEERKGGEGKGRVEVENMRREVGGGGNMQVLSVCDCCLGGEGGESVH